MPDAPVLIPILGDGMLLRDAAPDPARRVVERVEGELAGIAAWADLYGRRAEGVVALRDPAALDVAHRLMASLVDRIAGEGLVLLRFAVLPEQAAVAGILAGPLAGAALGEHLTVRLD